MLQSNLKQMLDSRRLSIREFSRIIDYRPETVRLLYNNELVRIPAELIVRICKEFKCTPNDLFTITEEPESTEN